MALHWNKPVVMEVRAAQYITDAISFFPPFFCKARGKNVLIQ